MPDALANITGADALNAAFYFPWVRAPDPLQQGALRTFPPCGFVAGIYARTDSARGVWKAPAGIEASADRRGRPRRHHDRRRERAAQPARRQLPAHAFRSTATSSGARARSHGANDRGSEWKYVPVRRMALFLEESLYRGTQWVVFEPNDEPLWAQIRLNIGAFMQNLFRQGAFQGTHAARGLLRQVRPRDHDPDRHQPRHRQHPRRLRAAQAGRVRRHQDPADRRRIADLRSAKEQRHGPVHRQSRSASTRTRTSSSG